MQQLDPLQQSLIDDFSKVLATSTLMWQCWQRLPDIERQVVATHYLELMWQVMLAGAEPLMEGTHEEAADYYKKFGGFILGCHQNQRHIFTTHYWAAMDVVTYNELMTAWTESNSIKGV